jgi:hypothetical protein
MGKLGLKPVPECACLFTSDKLIVFFYVDDSVVLYPSSDEQAYKEFRASLMSHFKLTEIGELKWFLGIRILRDRIHHRIWLCQDPYITNIARIYNLEHRKAKVPLSPEKVLTRFDGEARIHEKHLYQRKVGSIGYPATITRPDCSRALQKLSEFQQLQYTSATSHLYEALEQQINPLARVQIFKRIYWIMTVHLVPSSSPTLLSSLSHTKMAQPGWFLFGYFVKLGISIRYLGLKSSC